MSTHPNGAAPTASPATPTCLTNTEQAELDSHVQSETLRFTAIDPGKFIGWARFENHMPVTVGVLEFGDSFYDWLAEEKPDLFVVENYLVRPAAAQKGYAHQWNKGEALQVIGAVKYHAHHYGIPLVLQQASIQPHAAKRSGIPYKKGRSNDINSAVLHGTHWWFNNRGPTHESQKGSPSSS